MRVCKNAPIIEGIVEIEELRARLKEQEGRRKQYGMRNRRERIVVLWACHVSTSCKAVLDAEPGTRKYYTVPVACELSAILLPELD